MDKYIEIDRAIETALLLLEEGEDEQTLAYNAALVTFVKNMENQPTADVQKVKHGRWIETTVPELWECSVCGCVIYSETEIDRNIYHKWCSRCGAKMDEVKQNG